MARAPAQACSQYCSDGCVLVFCLDNSEGGLTVFLPRCFFGNAWRSRRSSPPATTMGAHGIPHHHGPAGSIAPRRRGGVSIDDDLARGCVHCFRHTKGLLAVKVAEA